MGWGCCGYDLDGLCVARELVVGKRRVTTVGFHYHARFQGRFLVVYRLNTKENLMRSSFVGETLVVNVSPS